MKQYDNILPRPHLAENFAAAGATLSAGKRRFATSFRTVVNRMQIARMETALRALSDQELNNIELKRADIPQRARELVTYRYDGL